MTFITIGLKECVLCCVVLCDLTGFNCVYCMAGPVSGQDKVNLSQVEVEVENQSWFINTQKKLG